MDCVGRWDTAIGRRREGVGFSHESHVVSPEGYMGVRCITDVLGLFLQAGVVFWSAVRARFL